MFQKLMKNQEQGRTKKQEKLMKTQIFSLSLLSRQRQPAVKDKCVHT